MLNYLWTFMIIAGIVYGTMTGNIEGVSNGLIEGGGEAVSLCITMLGIVSIWTGLMNIAQKSGLIESIQKKIQPLIHYFFPNIPKGHPAAEYITINIIANLCGLGWAATPAGLKAMEELSKLNPNSDKASDEMCTFLIINISSLQLIPVNIIAYRSQYGSVNPTAVIVPGLLATLCSTITALVFCKIMTRKNKRKINNV